MSFYTYLHRRTSDGAVFYVGKGARNDRHKTRAGRKSIHAAASGNKKTAYGYRWERA